MDGGVDYGAETIIFWERLLTIRSRSQTPRMIGEVVVPLVVTFKILRWVMMPPR